MILLDRYELGRCEAHTIITARETAGKGAWSAEMI